MGNPRETGISGITGKVVYIRHANESEWIDIADILKKRQEGFLDVSGADAVVASREDRILGFAVLSKDAKSQIGRLSLYGSRRRRGIGREVLRHLLDYSAMKHIAADRVAGRHLLALGFQRQKAPVRKEGGILRNTDRGRRKVSSLIYARASN